MKRLPNVHVSLKKAIIPMIGIFLMTVSFSAQGQSLTCADRTTSLDGITCMNTYTAVDLGGSQGQILVLHDENGALIANNLVTSIHIGQNLTYSIFAPGNLVTPLCWARLLIEDKAPPIITCPREVDIYCSESSDTSNVNIGKATATDCSGIASLTFFDETRNLDCQDNALDFDGVDDYVEIADDPSFNFDTNDDFTIEAWLMLEVQSDEVEIDNSIIEKWSGGGGYPFAVRQMNSTAGVDAGKIRVLRYDGSVFPNLYSTDPLDDGEWHHIAFVKNGTTLSLYVDGQLDGSVTDNTVASTTNSSALFLGRRGGSNTNHWNGKMDEFRTWSDARTASEISSNYDRTLNGNETDLAHYYSFDQGEAGANNTGEDQLTDEAGSLDGTLTNFTLTGATSNWVDNRYQASLYSQIITRTWVAVDNLGMSASCQQEIRIRRADIAHVIFPSDFSDVCTNAPSTDPSVTGYPRYTPAGLGLDTIDIIPRQTGGACMLISTYSDNVIPKCGPTQLIKRTWQVINMCQVGGIPNVMVMMDQNITITTPTPTIDPIAAVTINADGGLASVHGGCSSTAALPTATVSGLCTGQVVNADDIVISIPGIGQIPNGGNIPAPGLSIIGSPHIVTYMATDTCGNSATLDVEVTVVDNTAPQCNTQNANIQLGTDGTATASVATFDRNSSDNCSPNVWISIRRLNGLCTTGAEDDFGPTVDFCCDDISSGIQDTVMIQQLVCDRNPATAANYSDGVVSLNSDGSPGATFTGRCTRCMASAIVKISTDNSITCPGTVRLSCDTYDSNTLYGAPTFNAECSTGLTTSFSDSGVIDCAQDTSVITRTHQLLASDGTTVLASCTQEIRVGGGVSVVVPNDTTINCMTFTCANLPTTTETGGEPTLTGCFSGVAVFTPGTPSCVADGDSLVITRTWTLTAPADLAACFAGQIFTQRIVAEDCCQDTDITLILPQAGTSADFLFNIGDIADFTWDWFNGQSSSPGASLGQTDTKPATGLTSGLQYHLIINQNNNSACADTIDFNTPSANIVGLVIREDATPVQSVRVALESNQLARAVGKDEVMMEMMTDDQGSFEFTDVDIPSVNKLTLLKDGDDRDNISTRDLLKLARHILGVRPITSPYAYIAADLSGNGKISTGDMLLMQRLILGIQNELPDNSSWRFVKEDHVFDDMNKILDYDFPEQFIFTGDETPEELSKVNFIAIKVGDLGNAYGVDLQGGNSTPKTLSLRTDNQQFKAGDLIEVPITAAQASNISGYQHAYQFDTDKIVFTGIDFGAVLGLDDNNFGYRHLGEGLLTTSWFDTENRDIDEATVLYTLRFEVREAGALKDVLNISSKETKAEAYFDNDRIGKVQFNFVKPQRDALVLSNTPNPFKGSTQVNFDAPERGEAVLLISDISGREIYRSEINAVKGTNQITLDKSNLKEVGIYILKLSLNGLSAAQKIVMIE